MTPLSPVQQAAFDALVPCAITAERRTGFPAEAICAAAAIESSWGARPTGDFNLFGLTKATNPELPGRLVPTHEVLSLSEFAKLPMDERESVTERVDMGHGTYRYSLSRWFPSFPSMQAAVDAYAALITRPGSRYAAAWQAYQRDHKMDALLDGVAKAGYATGSDYGLLLRQVANGSRIAMAVLAARGRAIDAQLQKEKQNV